MCPAVNSDFREVVELVITLAVQQQSFKEMGSIQKFTIPLLLFGPLLILCEKYCFSEIFQRHNLNDTIRIKCALQAVVFNEALYKSYPCSSRNRFIISNDFPPATGVLTCFAKVPLDIDVLFVQPAQKKFRFDIIGEKCDYCRGQPNKIIAKFYKEMPWAIRVNIFYPLDNSVHFIITLYSFPRSDGQFLGNQTSELACWSEDNLLVLPCITTNHEKPELILDQGIENKSLTEREEEYILDLFRYDPAIGFIGNGSLISKFNSNNSQEFICSLNDGKDNRKVGMSYRKCDFDEPVTTKLYDSNNTYLECVIRESESGKKPNHDWSAYEDEWSTIEDDGSINVTCTQKYYWKNSKQIPSFRIVTATTAYPNSAWSRNMHPFLFNVEGVEGDIAKYGKIQDKYVSKPIHSAVVGLFETNFHFIYFEVFIDLDSTYRMVPQNYSELNTSQLIKISELRKCLRKQNSTIPSSAYENRPNEYFSGGEYCFQCVVSTYMLRSYVTWHLQLDNGSSEWLNSGDIFWTSAHKDAYIIKIVLNSTMKGITCRAVLWNGNDLESTFHFVVNDPKPPVIIPLQSATDFREHDTNKTISCRANGVPTPEIRWVLESNSKKPSVEYAEIRHGTEIESRLIFTTVNMADAGEYTCKASNDFGESSTQISVRVIPRPEYTTGIVVSFTAFIIVLASAAVFLVRKYRRGNMLGLTKEEISDLISGKALEISRTDFEIDERKILDQGAYGVVYLTSIGDTKAAAKTIGECSTKMHLLALLSELKLLAFIASFGPHEHIVSLLGAYTTKLYRGEFYIFLEYCELGSLLHHLKNIPYGIKNKLNTDASHSNITRQDMISWSHQIALGMEYLTSLQRNMVGPRRSEGYLRRCLKREKPFETLWVGPLGIFTDDLIVTQIVHGDLATRNVLLTEQRLAKISDFGLSRRLDERTERVRPQKGNNELEGPWRWMSIEALRRSIFSEKSDVWSYGVTLWEIFTFAEVPYGVGQEWNVDFARKLESGEIRLDKPDWAHDDIFSQMKQCWMINPDDRPTFKMLVEFFTNVKEDIATNARCDGLVRYTVKDDSIEIDYSKLAFA